MTRFARIASIRADSTAARRFTTWRAFSSLRAFATAFLVAIAIFFSSVVQAFAAATASLRFWNSRVFATLLSSMSPTRSSLPTEAGRSSRMTRCAQIASVRADSISVQRFAAWRDVSSIIASVAAVLAATAIFFSLVVRAFAVIASLHS